MAQPSQVVPTVTMNVAGDKQQVNLRDYLNVRMAPFLKKAIHESLDAEAEYPLQWLGEYLIQQSILHEGNPDSNNIRERFLYKHDIPTTKAPASTTAVESNNAPPMDTEHAASSLHLASTNPVVQGDAAIAPTPASAQAAASTNGILSASQNLTDTSRDTEMGGTS